MIYHRIKASIFVLMVLFIGCSENTSTANKYSIIALVDLTELEDNKTILKAEDYIYNELSKELGINNVDRQNEYGIFKLFELHDYSTSRPYPIEVPKPKGFNETRTQRQDVLTKTNNSLKSIISRISDHPNLNNDSLNFNKSYIIEPISNAISDLNRSDANSKRLIIFSDMLENSDLFSFYSPDLKEEEFHKILNEHFSTFKLKDIEIKIVFIPNKANNKLQRVAKRSWINFLKKKMPKSLTYNTYLD